VRRAWATLGIAVAGAVLSSCGGGKHEARHPSRGGSINVAIVDTPNTEDLARLTPSLFTANTHITVNYTILDEDTLRDVISNDVATRAHQFDVVMIGPYEAPQYAKDGYITDLTGMVSSDRAYELGDIIPSIRKALSYSGRLYASPFYGESSFLMYRKDVLRDAGLTMPAHPTWPQVAAIARKITRPNMAGICLRKTRLGRARSYVHDRAEHVRWNVVVREAKRIAGEGDGRPACVSESAPVLRQPGEGCGRA
jgi:sorbitol/mannitol transport system substrate-binding protein